jgi:hypothetical protein
MYIVYIYRFLYISYLWIYCPHKRSMYSLCIIMMKYILVYKHCCPMRGQISITIYSYCWWMTWGIRSMHHSYLPWVHDPSSILIDTPEPRVVVQLKSWLLMFYNRHHDIINGFSIFVSMITSDIFSFVVVTIPSYLPCSWLVIE